MEPREILMPVHLWNFDYAQSQKIANLLQSQFSEALLEVKSFQDEGLAFVKYTINPEFDNLEFVPTLDESLEAILEQVRRS